MSAQNPINSGYHVTNVPKDEKRPSWDLQTSPASTPWIDHKLLGKMCVFLSTTQYKDRLPTISVYPTEGIPDKAYHRVQIPLYQFNDYEMRYVNAAGNQVLLLLARPEIDDKIANQFEAAKEPNGWLWRKKDNGVVTWYTNDYDRQGYFVNVAILHEVSTQGCNWDTVRHRG